MKVLVDTCLAATTRQVLVEDMGHDVETTTEWPEDPSDEALLAYARREGRVLVTLDKDFGEHAIVRGQAYAGIVRLVDIRADVQGIFAASALAKYADELLRGAIVTVGTRRIRVRPPQSDV